MTVKEFSESFDVLLSSYSSQAVSTESFPTVGIVFDEYEKSLFLTQAQEQIVVELYTGRNTNYTSFEETEELRSNLRNLIKTEVLEPKQEGKGLSKNSKFYILPDDNLFITYEFATINDESAGCKNGDTILVVPVTQDEFYRVNNNPFKGANERRALRADTGLNIVEIISKYNIKDYTIRYLSKPTPIVLDNFEEVSIDGVNKITECKLDSVLHRPILERAVLLAASSKGLQNKK